MAPLQTGFTLDANPGREPNPNRPLLLPGVQRRPKGREVSGKERRPRVSADESDDLLRRCQRGDDAALTVLVRIYQERLFRLAYRVLGDAGLAEEATADAFLKVWDRCRQWRGDARAGTWIYRLALRTVLDRARRLKPAPITPPETPDSRPTPLEAVLEEERRQRLRQQLDHALGQLSADDRALLHLHYFEQREPAEIEELLGVGHDALKMRLSRARQRLRPFLEGCDDLL